MRRRLIPWHPSHAEPILEEVVEALRQGALVLFPTETVYCVGGAVQPGVVATLHRLPRLDRSLPLILLMPSLRHTLRWTRATHHATIIQLAQAFWPGSLTIVAAASRETPPFVQTGECIAVRISSHSFCIALLQRWQQPVVMVMALMDRRELVRTAGDAVRGEMVVDLIIDGGTLRAGRPSTVISLLQDPPVILRPGPIGRHAIERVLHIPIGTRHPD